MKLPDAILHECRTRLLRPAVLVSLAIYAAALVYGAISGRIERDARIQAIAEHEGDVAARMQKWLTDLTLLEEKGAQGGAPPWSGSAMDVVFASSLPPGALADFAVGQADLLPYAGVISLWDPDIRLFSRYEFEDPVSLALGSFDLSKAVILLLPLVLIALCFDVLAAERDATRLTLIVAQGGRIRTLCWGRLLIRATLVVLATLLIASGALVIHAGPVALANRVPPFLWWAAALALYAAFWIAMIAFVAGRNRSGGTNLINLLLAWATLVIVLPAAISAVSESLYPAPSRLTYLAETRETEIATERAEPALTQQFALDHPELTVSASADMPAYVRTAFLVTTAVDDATREIMNRFDAAAAQREEKLSLLQYLSPAIVLHGLFNDLAASSAVRHRSYMAQAKAFKAAFAHQVRAYVMSGRGLPSREVGSLKRFEFDERPFSGPTGLRALTFLAGAAGLMCLLADRRLRRVRVLAP